ncbi:MAG TPA: hypothetical protein DCL44_00305 [Elusimicrobia bacterium]|nr:hypothetical protein [Elusimicrobiota bacterium]
MSLSDKTKVPEVSALMSCYNGGRWLCEAIDSVLSQTFRDFEFIVVNDGSTDNTWEIIQSYRARDERIVAISKKNTGLADSLNTGIARARGSWIARVDQDDICEPVRLEKQLTFVRAHPGVALLGSGFTEINEGGVIITEHRYPSSHDALVGRLERLQGFFPHSSAFYLTDAARKAGGYNTRITRADDWRLWLELSLKGKLACLKEPLVRIRKHSGQMSLDNNGARQYCDAAAATVCHLLRKGGHEDPSISPDTEAWTSFLAWIDGRIAEDGVLVRRKAWGDARAAFFSARNSFYGAIKCASVLFNSGYAAELILNKIRGSKLPERLAREWRIMAAGKT